MKTAIKEFKGTPPSPCRICRHAFEGRAIINGRCILCRKSGKPALDGRN